MKKLSVKVVQLLMVGSILGCNSLVAEDTLRVTIKQADSLFLASNFKLLAYAFNIDAQKAQVIQAKLYPNPLFTADLNAYDPENSRAFHINSTGQKSFQLEQLILLGGKRKAQIELAKTNVKISELEFQQLLSELKFQLHNGMYYIVQQSVLITKYSKQLNMLDTILVNNIPSKKGNLTLKEIIRLKSFYLSLNNKRAEVLKTYFEQLSKVQTLLQSKQIIWPLVSDTDYTRFIKTVKLDELTSTALQNRPDFLITQQDRILAEQYIAYQKSMAVPDINLITSYDQRGGAFKNQFNVGFKIPLPVWNLNQGNIKTAVFQLKQHEYDSESIRAKLISDVVTYYHVYNQSVIEFQHTERIYNKEFEMFYKGITENFRKGEVSISEFVDLFESYNMAITEISRVKVQLNTSAEQLNFCTGREIFN